MDNVMRITIISVGTLKEKYLVDAVLEYSKRLTKYVTYEEVVLKDESNEKQNPNVIKENEGKKILQKIPSKSYVIALDVIGKQLSSEELANKFIDIFNYSSSSITFIIGGSMGLSDEVKKISDFKLSFSKMTFPHQLMKVILLEQIYRGFKINKNETYHK